MVGGQSGAAFTPPQGRRSSLRRWRIAAAILLAALGVLLFARLGARALWSAEFRWGEIAKEMLASGRYFLPTINGQVYFDKPLGSYWLITATAGLLGRLDETTVRLPSALMGLLALGFLLALARRLYDRRTAWVAVLILGTSYSFVFQSRLATSDIHTLPGELAALYLFLRNEKRSDGWWVLAFWPVMAVTSQMKGLIGFVLPLLVIGIDQTLAEGWGGLFRALLRGPLVQRGRWLVARNRWLFNRKTLLGVALGAVVYLLPFAISVTRTGSDQGLDLVFRENLVRFFAPFDHKGPIYLYTYVIFQHLAPWSLLLPAALWQIHSDRRARRGFPRADRFTLVFFWGIFLFFTLSGSRRSSYLLPILPAGALLLARLLVTAPESLARGARRLLAVGFGLAALLAAGSVVLLLPPHLFLPPPLDRLPPAPARPALALLWIGGIAAVVYAFRHLRPRRVLAAMAILAYGWMFYLFIFLFPAADAWRGLKPFAERVNQRLGSEISELAVFRTSGPDFYLHSTHLQHIDETPVLRAAVKAGRVRWVILRKEDLAKLGVPGQVVDRESAYPWESKGQHESKQVLFEVEPSPPPGAG